MALTQVPIELSSTPGIVDNSNATAITIDSSENVLVGTTDSAPGVGNTNTGGAFGSNGYGVFSRTGAAAQATAYFNKNTNDGTIIALNKDGTTVGSISTVAGRLGIGTGDSGLFFDDVNNRIGPVTLATGTPVDSNGLLDLGYSGARFKDLYLGNDIAHLDAAGNARLLYDRSSNLLGNAGTNLYGAGIYLGGTAAANLLDEYEEGTYTTAFTPHASGTITLSSTYNTMYYTKIGRVVICTGYFVVSSVSSPTGFLSISLPFPAKNVVNNSSSVYAAFNGMSGGSLSEIWGIIDTNSSAARFYYGASSSVSGTVANNVVATTDVRFQATYIID